MEILSLMLTALVVAGNISQVSGVRAYERRSDLLGVPDVGSIDWTVPLSNGQHESLPPVPQDKRLTYLALGRGHRTFACEWQSHNLSHAVLIEDTATLINVAPLLIYISDENDFHKLPAEIIQFDYSHLNTTYDCFGSYNRTDFASFFQIDGHDEIRVNVTNSILPPRPLHDMPWYSGVSVDIHEKADYEWMYYVVETDGGLRPDCGLARHEIRVEYAAEFWLYHRIS